MNTHNRKHPFPNAANTSPVNFNFRPKTHLSARKLASRLWHLRFFQIQSSLPRVNRKEEVVTNTHSRKLLRETKLLGDSVVSVLLSELLRAQTCINKLKAQHKSFQNYFYEENLLWKRRQLHKNQALLEDLKDKLARERRSRERMESLNAKLVNELAEAKLYARQFMINYKEEKRKRQLMEELCNELALQVGEDKAKLEGLQRYSVRICEEMEQERKMFHMVELWREESIQMKLLDAKLALEDKYNQMIHVIALLQSFLRSRGDELQTMDAQLIKQAAESVNVELSCDFTKSNDVEFEPYYLPSSTVNIVSLDEDYCLNNNSELHQLSTSLDNVRLGSEAECCESAEDEHCDSVAQQNSHDSTCEERVMKSSVQSGGIGSTFMCKSSGENGFRECELFGQRNFADSVNPHITRGMKGCIEWPRPSGIPKINSKVIPLEERVRKQKSQLQHILKPLA